MSGESSRQKYERVKKEAAEWKKEAEEWKEKAKETERVLDSVLAERFRKSTKPDDPHRLSGPDDDGRKKGTHTNRGRKNGCLQEPRAKTSIS